MATAACEIELAEWLEKYGVRGVCGHRASVQVVGRPQLHWYPPEHGAPGEKNHERADPPEELALSSRQTETTNRPELGLVAARSFSPSETILKIPSSLTMCSCRALGLVPYAFGEEGDCRRRQQYDQIPESHQTQDKTQQLHKPFQARALSPEEGSPATSLWATEDENIEELAFDMINLEDCGGESVTTGGGLEEKVQQATLRPAYPPSGDQSWAVWEGITALAAWVLRERAAGGDSSWAPFLRSLPDHVALPAFMPHSLLGMLQNEAVAQRAKVLHETYENEYHKCLAHNGGEGIAFATREEFFWACSIVSSRSFSGGHGKECSLLVPLADLMNHSQHYNTTWTVSPAGFTLHSTVAIKQGEELLLSYGSKCSDSLLLSYGFCPTLNSFDCTPLFSSRRELIEHFSSTFFPTDFSREDRKIAEELVEGLEGQVCTAVSRFRAMLELQRTDGEEGEEESLEIVGGDVLEEGDNGGPWEEHSWQDKDTQRSPGGGFQVNSSSNGSPHGGGSPCEERFTQTSCGSLGGSTSSAPLNLAQSGLEQLSIIKRQSAVGAGGCESSALQQVASAHDQDQNLQKESALEQDVRPGPGDGGQERVSSLNESDIQLQTKSQKLQGDLAHDMRACTEKGLTKEDPDVYGAVEHQGCLTQHAKVPHKESPGGSTKPGPAEAPSGARMRRTPSNPPGDAKGSTTYAAMLSSMMYGPQFELQGAGGEWADQDQPSMPLLVWPQGCFDPRILAALAALWHLFVYGQEANPAALADACIIYCWKMTKALRHPQLKPCLVDAEIASVRAGIRALLSRLGSLLAEYPTSFEEDAALMETLQQTGVSADCLVERGQDAGETEHQGGTGGGGKDDLPMSNPVLGAMQEALSAGGAGIADGSCWATLVKQVSMNYVRHRMCKKLLLLDLQQRLTSASAATC